MRALQVTIFVLGLMVLGTQTFRHVYVKWIAPEGSILDAYQDEVEENIAKSEDLDDLEALYKDAHERVKAHDREHPEEMHNEAGRKLRHEKMQLEFAIRQLESQRKSMFDLWFYWLCGLASIGFGLLAYTHLNRWLGMVGIITGFMEMAFWTSPLWRSGGPQGEFERLLTYKLVLSFVSIVLLIALWLRLDKPADDAPVTVPE